MENPGTFKEKAAGQ